MSVFKNVDTVDLLDRYRDLIEKYVKIAQELAPKLEKFGKYRQELQQITIEFVSRGISAQDPESLVKVVEEELRKREVSDTQNTNQDK